MDSAANLGSRRVTSRRFYGGCPGDSIGFSVRYQGELLGLRDPQNRDLRRKSPPETKTGWLIITPSGGGGVLISGQIYVLTIYVHIAVVNSGIHDSPHIRKSSLDHDSGAAAEKIGN